MDTTPLPMLSNDEAWGADQTPHVLPTDGWSQDAALPPRASTGSMPGAWARLPGERPTVLIVDDDDSIAELLADLLSEEGYRVVIAREGRAALRAVRRERPAMVLSDCMMPGLSGEEFVRELRRHPATRGVPVVLMSSTRPLKPDLANVPFLAKPFELDDVIRIVARHAGAHSFAQLYGEA
jgi:CheY-like chemotaxis protein